MPPNVKKPLSLSKLYLSVFTVSAASLIHAATDNAAGELWSCQAKADGSGWECGATTHAAPTQLDQAATPSAPATESTTTAAIPVAPAITPSIAQSTVDNNNPATAKSNLDEAPIAPNVDNATPPALWMNFEAWDWVPLDALPETTCARDDGLCDGAYIEPPRDWTNSDKSPTDMPIDATASSADLQDNTVNMAGSVTMFQGYRRIRALNADLARDKDILYLRGGVEVREPETLIRGQTAALNLKTGLGEVSGASFLDYDSGTRITATSMKRTSAQTLVFRKANYTQCTPDDDTWSLFADKVYIDDATGRGEAKRATLRIADVPVLYTPYLNFPIDDRRMSGFLWPSFGSTDAGGTDIAVPYYLNLAPNYDATITPRTISDRGDMLATQFRYLNQYSNWDFTNTYINDDKQYNNDSRWLFGTLESGSFNEHISQRINYTKVSDDDYFRDLDLTSLELRRETQLTQTADMNYLGDQFYADIQVLQYQTLADDISDPYKELPRITWSKRSSGANFAFEPLWDSEFVSFDNKNPASDYDYNTAQANAAFVTGNRVYVAPGVAFPMHWLSAYVTPSVKIRNVSYSLDRADGDPTSDTPSTTVPLASLDMGLFFEKAFQWDGESYLQTFEPRAFYLYSPDKNQSDNPNFDTTQLTFGYQQLFRDQRFTGHDLLGDNDQLTVGFTSRLLEDESGREKLNVSLGQILYFTDPQITLNQTTTTNNDENASQSELAGEINYQIIDGTWASTSVLWDNEANLVNDAAAFLHHQSENDLIYNLGYTYQRADSLLLNNQDELRQADASVEWPINNSWGIFTRWNYDLQNDSSFEEMFGVEYRECCWLARLVFQNALQDTGETDLTTGQPITERDNIIMLEFQLRGLGGIGDRTKSMLRESIWGYRERN
jgi:LPS-assembly protein